MAHDKHSPTHKVHHAAQTVKEKKREKKRDERPEIYSRDSVSENYTPEEKTECYSVVVTPNTFNDED